MNHRSRHEGTIADGFSHSSSVLVLLIGAIAAALLSDVCNGQTTAAPTTSAPSSTGSSVPNATSAPGNSSSLNTTITNDTTTAPSTTAVATPTTPSPPTGAVRTRIPSTLAPTTPAPQRPTAAPFPAGNYFPLDTAAANSAVTRNPSSNFGALNFTLLEELYNAQGTAYPIQQIAVIDPNATSPKYYSQVDIIFSSFSESRVGSYLKMIAQTVNISQTRVQPVYSSADGRVSLEFGRRYLFSVRILSDAGLPVANNVTHALSFAMAGNITLQAAVEGSDLYRATVLYATAVYPTPFALTLVPVGVNYVWVAFILGGVVCCCFAAIAIFCKSSSSGDTADNVPESPKAILDRVPEDTLDDNRVGLQKSVEQFQRARSMHLLSEAKSGKSLLGAASAERAVVSRTMGKDDRALFLREVNAMPVEVLLEHDRLFQLPPNKADQERALKKLASFTRGSKASRSSDDSGSTDDGPETPGRRPKSARNLQLVEQHNQSARERARSTEDPADGTSKEATSASIKLPSSVARFVESDDDEL